MLIKVKTLTGKEIEIDIEPNDKVERIKERVEEKVPPRTSGRTERNRKIESRTECN